MTDICGEVLMEDSPSIKKVPDDEVFSILRLGLEPGISDTILRDRINPTWYLKKRGFSDVNDNASRARLDYWNTVKISPFDQAKGISDDRLSKRWSGSEGKLSENFRGIDLLEINGVRVWFVDLDNKLVVFDPVVDALIKRPSVDGVFIEYFTPEIIQSFDSFGAFSSTGSAVIKRGINYSIRSYETGKIGKKKPEPKYCAYLPQVFSAIEGGKTIFCCDIANKPQLVAYEALETFDMWPTLKRNSRVNWVGMVSDKNNLEIARMLNVAAVIKELVEKPDMLGKEVVVVYPYEHCLTIQYRLVDFFDKDRSQESTERLKYFQNLTRPTRVAGVKIPGLDYNLRQWEFVGKKPNSPFALSVLSDPKNWRMKK